MRVLLAGSSGLIGTALADDLRAAGHPVRTLVRRDPRTPDEHRWDPPAGEVDAAVFEGVDAVVNLCGAPLLPGRWSAARKQVLRDSRTEPTEVLAEAVARHGIGLLVNASAVGYYGDAGPSEVDESAAPGTGFLAEVCVAWEAATAAAERAGARVVHLRTGLVLSRSGGLLGPLRPLFKLALGGRLGSGRQYMPWIALADEIAAVRHVLDHDDVRGPVNLSAPNPVTNTEFTAALGRAVHRPALFWVPGPAMKLALGQAAEEMALYGQRAVPHALTASGFVFAHTRVEDALAAAV